MPTIDLHLHSTESDGIFSPEKRVQQAKRRRLALVALTDHDTLSGLPRFLRLARAANLKVTTGVEISTDFRGVGLHILAYGIPHRDRSLLAFFRAQSADRERRAKKSVKLLQKMGFRITLAAIRKEAKGNIGKPHIAKAILADAANRRLLKQRFGFSGNWSELIGSFFDRPGKRAYIPRMKAKTTDVIRLVRRTGGVPVLAHPLHDFASVKEAAPVVRALSRAGLQGLEAVSPWNGPRTQTKLIRLAKECGLLVTAGTDNHENTNPGINVPTDIYRELVKMLTLK